MGILNKIAIFCLNFPLRHFYSMEKLGTAFSDVSESLLNTWRQQTMKQLLLVLLAAFSTAATTQAELVIDDFTGPTGTALNVALNDGIAGTRTVVATGSSVMTVDGAGNGTFTGGLFGGSRIDIDYVFTTSFNMNAPGGGLKTLSVDLFDTVTGDWSLEAFFTNSAALQSNVGPIAVSTPGARSFSSTLLPVAVATDVKSLTLRLKRLTDGAVITFSGGVVSAVPEPTSLVLLGITGLGGWYAARRRGKKTETVV